MTELTAEVEGPLGQGASPQGAEVTYYGSQWSGSLLSAYSPQSLGLEISGQSWSGYLDLMCDKVVLGRELINGFDCIGVMFDMDPAGLDDDGEYVYPWKVWFDDGESLLAIRLQSFVTTSAAAGLGLSPASIERHKDVIGGVEWVPFRLWEVQEAAPLDGLVWVPLRAEVSHPLFPAVPDITVVVDALTAELNSDSIGSRLVSQPSLPTRVVDETLGGEAYAIGVDGQRFTVEDYEFYRSVRRLRVALGRDPEPVPLTHIPFAELSCGPSAVLAMALALTEERPAVETLLALVPSVERDLGEASVNTLQTLLEACGISASAVRFEAGALPDPHVPMIVLTRRNDESHFEAVVRSDRGVLVVSPPKKAALLSEREFLNRWTGVGLLILPGEAAGGLGVWQFLVKSLPVVVLAVVLFLAWRMRRSPEAGYE